MNDRVLKTAFVISMAGHCLVFGVPGFNPPSLQIEKPEEIAVRIEIEKPMLLPKIDVIGEEKKLKKVEETKKEPETESQPREMASEKRLEEIAKEKIEVIDPAQEEMFRYQDAVKQRIQDARRYPAWAKRQGLEGTVDMGFTVLSDGTSRDIAIMGPSSSGGLDEEAVQTIRRAGPFPRIPKELRRTFLRMRIAIVFSLQR